MGKTHSRSWWLDNEGQKEQQKLGRKGVPNCHQRTSLGQEVSMPPPHPHIQFFLMLREETGDVGQLSPNHPNGDQILDL